MEIKCNCDMKTKLVGDGCQKCNTKYALGVFPAPVEISDMMESAGFTVEQATCVAAEIVQPLMSYICTLSEKIDDMARVI